MRPIHSLPGLSIQSFKVLSILQLKLANMDVKIRSGMFCCAQRAGQNVSSSIFVCVFHHQFTNCEKIWILKTKIAILTWKEKPYAKVHLGFGFSVKFYVDFLDSRLLIPFLSPFSEGLKLDLFL